MPTFPPADCPIEVQLSGIPANQGLYSADSQRCTVPLPLWDLLGKEIKICLQAKLDFQFNGDRGYLLCFVTVIQIPRAKSVIEKISPLFLLNLRVGAKYAITSVHKIANHTIIKCIV